MSNLGLEPSPNRHLISGQMNSLIDQNHYYIPRRQSPRSHIMDGILNHSSHVGMPQGVRFGSQSTAFQKLHCLAEMASPSTTASPTRSMSAMPVLNRRRNNSTSSSQIMTASRRAQSRPRSLMDQRPVPTPAKSKRTRTGCLTCRSRHLKCDEALPHCINCLKTNRQCRRGLKLNFIHLQVQQPPQMSESSVWSVRFQDESREIASEYRGGLNRYAQREPSPSCHQSTPALSRLKAENPDPTHGAFPLKPTVKVEEAEESIGPLEKFYSTEKSPSIATEMDGLMIRRITYRPSDVSSVNSMIVQVDSSSPLDSSDIGGSIDEGGFDFNSIEDTEYEFTSGSIAIGMLEPSLGKSGLTPASGSDTTPRVAKHDTSLVPKEQVAKNWLRSPDEAYYMQVFVENVAVWMDSFDKDKHFSRLIPYQALKSPMLLNSFLACGVQHLTLVEPGFKDEKALLYYDTATSLLLRSLQNPDRDMSECAVAAVALNVYEVMSERPSDDKMTSRHISGARALIRECGWNAKSAGIGAACFWLNIGMEVLSCLSFNWGICWDPDDWGLDMNFGPASSASLPATPSACGSSVGQTFYASISAGPDTPTSASSGVTGIRSDSDNEAEEVWVHRIFYIVAKIANFREKVSDFPANSHGEQVHFASRLAQWHELKKLCGRWNACCPRTMHPLAYIAPGRRTGTESVFPKIWLTVRASVIGRLFYHTAECLLAQTKPVLSSFNNEAKVSQLHHAHQICGIVAHATDPGIASVAIRSLAIAAPVLAQRSEQTEALSILERIHSQSGWELDEVVAKLKEAWGWECEDNSQQPQLAPCLKDGGQQSYQDQQLLQREQSHVLPHHAANNSGVQLPSRLHAQAHHIKATGQVNVLVALDNATTRPATNPLYCGDFSHPDHPYQNWYAPPNRSGNGPFVAGFL